METLMDEWIEKVMHVCVYVKKYCVTLLTGRILKNKEPKKKKPKKKTISTSWTHRYREQIGG